MLHAKAGNSGHNCLAAELIVTCRQWPQREAFLAELRRLMSSTPQRCHYYPGTFRPAQTLWLDATTRARADLACRLGCAL